MKFKIALCICLIWLCTANIKAQSCCSGGGSSCCTTGGGGGCSILPDLDKHLIGLHYVYSLYKTTVYTTSTMNMNGMDMSMMGPGTPASGTVNTLELFGRFNLPKRFQISASVPVQFLKEESRSARERSAGLGDMSVMATYSFLNPIKFADKKSKHQLRLGLGIKAPTGKFSMTNDGLFTTDLQLGTGSVDFLFNVNYTYRYQQFGLNISSSYRKNLANKYRYRFGDNINEGLSVFYAAKLPKGFTITPKLGTTYNHAFFNVYNKESLTGTGGDVLRGTVGLDIYYRHFALSTSVAPMLLDVYNWSGEPVPVLSFETGFYYSF